MANQSAKWHRYLRFWRPNVAADVDAEVAFHIDARADELCAAGLDRGAARARAEREFGDVDRTRATLRDMDERHAALDRRANALGDLGRDVKVAVRALRRSPGLVAVVVLTFALGIGITSAIYSVVDAFMFRPLPGAYGRELVVLGRTDRELAIPHPLSYPDYADIRADTAVFASLTAYTSRLVDLNTDRGADRIWIDDATANYFSTLGLAPMLGRTFSPGDDDGELAHPEMVLTYVAWQRRFAGDSGVIGRVIRINDHPVTVIGVMPPSFHGVRAVTELDGVVPINQVGPVVTAALSNRRNILVNVFGRLRDGVSMSAAARALHLKAAQLARAYPLTNANVDEMVVREHFARPDVSISGSTPVVAAIFMSLVLLVLLVACANVASVLLARVVVRRRELAIRTALGASQWRIVRQALVECSLLSLGGGLAALPVTFAAVRAMQSIRIATDLPIRWGMELDGRVLAFLALATLVAAVVASIAPAAAARHRDLNSLLKASAGNSASGGHTRLRSTLVIAQVAVSVVVLVCAGLLVRSARNALHMDFGFRPDHVAMAATEWRAPAYDSVRATRMYHDILAKAASIPGARSVALTGFLPFGFSRDNVPVFPIASSAHVPVNGFNYFYDAVGGDYFATMDVPLLAGRTFVPGDSAGATQVAIVNDALAKALWPGESAVGKQFHTRSAGGPVLEVVGVVRGMQDLVPGETPHPYIFRPLGQLVPEEMTLLVYTNTDAAAALPGLRRAITSVDAQLPVFDTRTIEQHLRDGQALIFPRLGSEFASIFGVLALLLATVGMYGVIAYSVAQRTREIGVRVALGARMPVILRLVVGQGMRLAWIGVAIGLALAVLVAGALRAILFGVPPRDPLVLTTVVVLVTIVAIVASAVPARRALRIDPIRALRDE